MKNVFEMNKTPKQDHFHPEDDTQAKHVVLET